METIHIAVMKVFVTVLRRGYQICRINIVTLTRRMNIARTEVATLKSVKDPLHTKGILGTG